jgi:hypothetical protein
MVNGTHICIATLAALSASCTNVIDASKVRAQFSADHFCPIARVTVRELPAPGDPVDTRPVPPEVVADGERLKLWQKSERARQERERERSSEFSHYAVEGCDIHQTLSCYRYRVNGPSGPHFQCMP